MYRRSLTAITELFIRQKPFGVPDDYLMRAPSDKYDMIYNLNLSDGVREEFLWQSRLLASNANNTNGIDYSGMDAAMERAIGEIRRLLSEPAGQYHGSDEYRAVLTGRREAQRRRRLPFFRFFRRH